MPWNNDSLADDETNYTAFLKIIISLLYGIIESILRSGAIAVSNGQFSEDSLPMVLGNVSCIGSESELIDCLVELELNTSCSPTEDAAVVCQG